MRAEKVQIRQEVQKLLDASSGAFLVSYKGMKVSDLSGLRKKLMENGSECHVVPNRILRYAAKESNLPALASLKVTGETALVSGGSDPAKAAKILKDFAKTCPVLVFKLGVLSGKVYQAADVIALADLPSIEVMRSQLLGLLQAPASQFVRVLNAKNASIVYAIKSYLDKKEQVA